LNGACRNATCWVGVPLAEPLALPLPALCAALITACGLSASALGVNNSFNFCNIKYLFETTISLCFTKSKINSTFFKIYPFLPSIVVESFVGFRRAKLVQCRVVRQQWMELLVGLHRRMLADQPAVDFVIGRRWRKHDGHFWHLALGQRMNGAAEKNTKLKIF
jgi:hypothetical protein